MPRGPSAWLSTVSAAISPARPLSTVICISGYAVPASTPTLPRVHGGGSPPRQRWAGGGRHGAQPYGSLGGEQGRLVAVDAGGGDRLPQPLNLGRRQFDQRRPHHRRGQFAEQRQHLLHP